MYKLYLDKSENFECDVAVKNASLKNSVARLVVESAEGINLVFNGKINNGKCNIPIRRLKGLLDETSHGKIGLEIIVEDTYFKPWESDFIVEQHTAINVVVNEQKQPSKPMVEVKIPSKANSSRLGKNNTLVPLYEISKLCERFKITRSSLSSRKHDFRQLVNEYFQINKEYSMQRNSILHALRHFLK
jgi:hypothetical protein